MRKVILIFVVAFPWILLAQQEPLFTQYYNNDMMINPAISGSKQYNPLLILTRQQWLGFEGAPFTTSISYHGALNNRSAMGGYLMFDKLYPSMQGTMQLNYAYHVPLDYNKVNLSFGLGAKVMYYNLDFNSEELPPGIDNAFSGDEYDKTLGDASFGVYLYGTNFYTGFSMDNLLRSSFNEPVSGSPYGNQKSRNYYVLTAYKFTVINKDWELEPSLLLRKIENFESVYDVSSRMIYLRNNWLGVTYRTDQTLVVGFGFGSENIRFSYSYDHTLPGEIQKYSYGTHEIGISFYILTKAKQRHVSFWGY